MPCIKTIPSLVTTDSYMSGHKGLIHLKINENHLKHTKTCLNKLDPETELHSHIDTSHLETPEKFTVLVIYSSPLFMKCRAHGQCAVQFL